MMYRRVNALVYQEADGFFDEEPYYEDEVNDPDYDMYDYVGDYVYEWVGSRTPVQMDALTLGAVGLIIIVLISLWMGRGTKTVVPAGPAGPAVATVIAPFLPAPPAAPPVEAQPLPADPAAVIAPYDNYIVTQGPHGYSYGHAAIDIKAGKGAVIKSPIEGVVTALYMDEIGNPTLVIENDIYQITMMHGEYTVAIGDGVKIGQPLGTESNLGNTTDGWGNSCRGRDCGYHTHLNIFDKRRGANVNPLDLIPNTPTR
jgi:murein DD-endopeptidase MepM/ murein hydrolase activator NlpD